MELIIRPDSISLGAVNVPGTMAIVFDDHRGQDTVVVHLSNEAADAMIDMMAKGRRPIEVAPASTLAELDELRRRRENGA